VTGRVIGAIKTGDIYWGVMPFIAIQVIVMSLVLAYPQILLHDKTGAAKMDAQTVNRMLQQLPTGQSDSAQDPMKLLLEQLKDEKPPR
ncbi:MAG: hypothetical protein OEU94_17035, partial [Aquincola sp.]|nr:hypothetical protein [Aquincola sp.]